MSQLLEWFRHYNLMKFVTNVIKIPTDNRYSIGEIALSNTLKPQLSWKLDYYLWITDVCQITNDDIKES